MSRGGESKLHQAGTAMHSTWPLVKASLKRVWPERMLRVAGSGSRHHKRGHTARPRAVGIARLGRGCARTVFVKQAGGPPFAILHIEQSRTHASSSRRLFTKLQTHRCSFSIPMASQGAGRCDGRTVCYSSWSLTLLPPGSRRGQRTDTAPGWSAFAPSHTRLAARGASGPLQCNCCGRSRPFNRPLRHDLARRSRHAHGCSRSMFADPSVLRPQQEHVLSRPDLNEAAHSWLLSIKQSLPWLHARYACYHPQRDGF